MVAYFAITSTFFSLQIGFIAAFATPWFLVPILFGLFVGGGRLAAWMTGIILIDAAIALLVGWSGRGLTVLAFPSPGSPASVMLGASGLVFVLLLIVLNERSRGLVRAELDGVLVALDEQERRLKTLVESTSDVMLLLDLDYRVLLANTAAQEFTTRVTCDTRPLVDRSFRGIVSAGSEALWRSRLETCAATGRVRAEDIISTADGDVHVESAVHRVVAGGRMIGYTLFCRDITERRTDEAALQRLRGQLLEASRLAGRSEVAASVLHNVGNVLTSVNVSAEEMHATASGLRISSFRNAVELLEAEAEPLRAALGERGPVLTRFLGSLVEGLASDRQLLLDESCSLRQRLEHIGVVLAAQQKHAQARDVLEEIDLDELVRAALALDDGLKSDDVELLCEVDAGARWIVSDRHKLLQILINLLRNARDAIRDGGAPRGRVRVQARPSGAGGVSLAVTDNGAGIDPDNQPAMFTSGFTTKPDGHGFGLHSAALLASELHGTLRFASAGLGHGATFTLELPEVAAAATGG
jgi:PAS domain S-box-containing protein